MAADPFCEVCRGISQSIATVTGIRLICIDWHSLVTYIEAGIFTMLEKYFEIT